MDLEPSDAVRLRRRGTLTVGRRLSRSRRTSSPGCLNGFLGLAGGIAGVGIRAFADRSRIEDHPDPSDGWDHSIKAIEAMLISLVSPNNAKATLGTVLAQLKVQAEKWQLILIGRSDSGGIEPLLVMLGSCGRTPTGTPARGTAPPRWTRLRRSFTLP